MAAALGCAGLASAHAAQAHLGGAYASVMADRAHMSAAMSSALGVNHVVHALTLANGGVVREFARGDGTVFAVAWRGPGRPDLRQLLGEQFPTFQTGSARALGRRTRAPLSVNRPELVVHSGGHPGSFFGVAYLPQLLPAGFSLQDLR